MFILINAVKLNKQTIQVYVINYPYVYYCKLMLIFCLFII